MIDTADSLQGLEDVASLHSSDLPRAVQSAHEVGKTLGMEIQPTPHLRDWNVGSLAGQLIKKILPQTHALMDSPDTPAPGRESYNDFLDRAVPALRSLVESPQTHIAVVHNRLTTLLHALSKTGGEYPDGETLKHKGPVEPSGALILDPQWNVIYTHKPTTS